MKFYIAGKFEERAEVRKLMDKVEELGHTITCDWTKHEQGGKDFLVHYAIADVEGVRGCDVYVGRFINENSYKGALSEMGMALGLDKKVVVIGHAIDSCIFTNHPNVLKLESEEAFLSELAVYYETQIMGLTIACKIKRD